MKTTMKAMIAMAFAAFAMTANANTYGNTWRNTGTAPQMVVNHNHHADWRYCHHHHIDRHGHRTFCRACGAEVVWRGGRHNGYYEAIPPRPVMDNHHHGGAPVPPPPGPGYNNHGGAPGHGHNNHNGGGPGRGGNHNGNGNYNYNGTYNYNYNYNYNGGGTGNGYNNHPRH